MCALQADGDDSGHSSRVLPGTKVQEHVLGQAARHESARVQPLQLCRVVLKAFVARQDDEVRRAAADAAANSPCEPQQDRVRAE